MRAEKIVWDRTDFNSSPAGDLVPKGYCERAARGRAEGVLAAASVGRTLSPSSSVVVLLMSDFHGFYY